MVLPELRAGDVVLWDGLGAHKRARVRELVESAGATVVFLPPYSPDTNPIEMAWSKVKAILRTHAARTWEALVDAVADALSKITLNDILGWFAKCGYGLQRQGRPLQGVLTYGFFGASSGTRCTFSLGS